MDYSMVYILLVGLCVVGIGVGIGYVKKQYNISNEKMVEGIDVSKTIVTFITISLHDMKFSDDNNEIEKVSNIVVESLDYIKDMNEVKDKKDKVLKATAYAIKLCKDLNIDMNKNRVFALNQVITLTYNMIEAIDEKKAIENK